VRLGTRGSRLALAQADRIAAPDGSSVIRAQLTGNAADGEVLGRRLAQVLLEHGGAALLDRTSYGHGQRLPGPDAALSHAWYR
jgi:porphobilinogen deaminase